MLHNTQINTKWRICAVLLLLFDVVCCCCLWLVACFPSACNTIHSFVKLSTHLSFHMSFRPSFTFLSPALPSARSSIHGQSFRLSVFPSVLACGGWAVVESRSLKYFWSISIIELVGVFGVEWKLDIFWVEVKRLRCFGLSVWEVCEQLDKTNFILLSWTGSPANRRGPLPSELIWVAGLAGHPGLVAAPGDSCLGEPLWGAPPPPWARPLGDTERSRVHAGFPCGSYGGWLSLRAR